MSGHNLAKAINQRNATLGWPCHDGTNRHDVSAKEFFPTLQTEYATTYRHQSTAAIIYLMTDGTLDVPSLSDTFDRGTDE